METFSLSYEESGRGYSWNMTSGTCWNMHPLLQGSALWHYIHFGLNNYFPVEGGTVRSIGGSLAMSLASAHQMPIAPLPYQVMKLKMSPDIGKYPLAVKLPPVENHFFT